MVEIQAWVLIGALLLMFYLAYDCDRLYKRNRELYANLQEREVKK